MWPIVRLLLPCVCASIGVLHAQVPRARVVTGDRVRIVATSVEGVFEVSSLRGDTLDLIGTTVTGATATNATRLALPWSQVCRLEVRRPRSSSAGLLRGAGIGLLAGAGTGAVLGFAAGDDPPGTFLAFTRGEKAAAGGLVLGTIGLLAGGVIGTLAPGVRWERVDLAERVGLSVGRGGTLALAYRHRF